MEARRSTLTDWPRVKALYNYQKPDRVPIYGTDANFAMINCGYSLADLQTDQQKTYDAVKWTCEQYGWERELGTTAHTILGSWDFGATMQMPESEYAAAISVKEYAVKTEEDVLNLKMPNYKTAGALPVRMEYSTLQERADLPITFVTRSPFTVAANICGVEQFCRWMLKKPELCHRLMQMSIDHITEVIQHWVNTFGAEKIFYFISSPTEANQIISPKHFKEYAIPYHIELQKRIRGMGIKWFMFHICGEQNLNLPHLAELASSADSWPHPSILNFGHEVKIDDAARYFPDDIISGNIEPAVILKGKPEQVYELSRLAIEKGRKIPGGFILSAGCGMPPRAPSYNVWMMTKAVNDFGWYD